MSGFFKSIGKIFGKILKVIIKIAPYALAAAAVIFTGGAALGLGFAAGGFAGAVGGVVSSLGLSAAVTGALTGAITSAGFGAALGFVTGGEKGMQKGALMGLLTGGVMGAVNPATFGIAKVANAAGNGFDVTTTTALANHGANTVSNLGNGIYSATPKGIAPVSLAPATPIPTLPGGLTEGSVDKLAFSPISTPGGATIAGAPGTQAAVTASQASGVGSGIGPQMSSVTVPQATAAGAVDATNLASAPAAKAGDFFSNLMGTTGGTGGGLTGLVGSVLQSVGGGNEYSQKSNAEVKAMEKLAKFAYGGVYAGKTDPFGIAGRTFAVPQPRYFYDKATNSVIDRQDPATAPPPPPAGG